MKRHYRGKLTGKREALILASVLAATLWAAPARAATDITNANLPYSNTSMTTGVYNVSVDTSSFTAAEKEKTLITAKAANKQDVTINFINSKVDALANSGGSGVIDLIMNNSSQALRVSTDSKTTISNKGSNGDGVWADGATTTFDNAGTITIAEANKNNYGIRFVRSASGSNRGTIQIESAANASAAGTVTAAVILADNLGNSSTMSYHNKFINTGKIEMVNNSANKSYGQQFYGVYSSGRATTTAENSGIITVTGRGEGIHFDAGAAGQHHGKSTIINKGTITTENGSGIFATGFDNGSYNAVINNNGGAIIAGGDALLPNGDPSAEIKNGHHAIYANKNTAVTLNGDGTLKTTGAFGSGVYLQDHSSMNVQSGVTTITTTAASAGTGINGANGVAMADDTTGVISAGATLNIITEDNSAAGNANGMYIGAVGGGALPVFDNNGTLNITTHGGTGEGMEINRALVNLNGTTHITGIGTAAGIDAANAVITLGGASATTTEGAYNTGIRLNDMANLAGASGSTLTLNNDTIGLLLNSAGSSAVLEGTLQGSAPSGTANVVKNLAGTFISRGDVDITTGGNAFYVTGNDVSSTTVDGANSTVKINGNLLNNAAANSVLLVKLNNAVSFITGTTTTENQGATTLKAANDARIDGDFNTKGGAASLDLAGGAQFTGGMNTSGGQSNLTLADNAKFLGNIAVSGGANAATAVDDAVITGDIIVNKTGVNTLTGFNNMKLNGNITVGDTGKNTITLMDAAEYTGDTTTEGQGAMTLKAANTARIDGDFNTKGGAASLDLAGGAQFTGDMNTSGGQSNLALAGNAKFLGNIAVSGGANAATAADDAVITGDIIVSKTGVNALTGFNNMKLNGNITVGDTGKNTIALMDAAEYTGDTTTEGQGVMTLKAANTARINGNFNTKGGTASLDLAGGAQFTGDMDTSGGQSNLALANNAKFLGNIAVSGGVNAATAANDAVISGDIIVNKTGVNTLTGFNNMKLKGSVTVGDTGKNTIALMDAAEYAGDATITGGASIFNITDTAGMAGNVTVFGGVSAINAGKNAVWHGDMSTNGGESFVNLTDSASWYGAAHTAGGVSSVKIEHDGRWKVTADSNVNNLDLNDNGKVILATNFENSQFDPITYETLTVDKLSGNGGMFIFDTDLDKAVMGSETTDGDKLIVNGPSTGTYYVKVADQSLYTGTEINGGRKLLLITDLTGGKYEFVGKALDQGGLWQVNPPSFLKEGNKWYLCYVEKEPNPTTSVSVLERHTVYNQWTRVNNDSLRKRLGDLRYNYNKEDDSGVWVRAYGGRLEGDRYIQKYHTIQLGIDKTDGNTAYGVAFDRQRNNQSYDHGSGTGTNYNGSLYITHYADNGTYWDLIGKYGRINSDYRTSGAYPDHADYDTHAYSLSAEYGRTIPMDKGYFWEPKMQLTYGYLTAENYTTDRKTVIREKSISSLIGRIGVVVGRKVDKDRDYYLKVNWFKEFMGDRVVHMRSANGENMYISENFGDSWFEVGLGGNVRLSSNVHLYGDVEFSLGAKVEKKWQLNAGVRWDF